ncbi:MAG TPA: helix-turn-helix domain-containing protein [Candidatus Nanopelagicaceae bacterium]|nr:helix-turn-helix domain-containing protein [Candidatus Nanopelagicaceae bacterium]
MFEDGYSIELANDELKALVLFALSTECRLVIRAVGDLVTPEDAAEILQVTRPTIYKWQDLGILGISPQGTKRMVPASDIQRLDEAQRKRIEVDNLLETTTLAEPMPDADYLVALKKARVIGGIEAVRQVRHEQRAAQARSAAAQAR